MAGVALGDIDVRFTWQAWHNLTSTFVLRGRRGTYGTGWRAWAGFSRPGRRGTFAWQVWHNLISTFVLSGRRGTISHPPSFCVAGVALVALGGALGLVLVARDATALCVAAFCVAGVALMALGGALGLVLVARDAAALLRGRCGMVWHNLTSTFVLRGRRGTCGTEWRAWAAFSRPGRRGTFAWLAWHLVTSMCVSRGRRGTISHPPSFCVAGVALMALGSALGLRDAYVTSTLVSQTISHTSLSHTNLSHTIFVTHHLSQCVVTHHLSYNLC